MASESLIDIFRRTAKTYSGRPAVVEPNKTMSYADLDSKSDEVADSIRNLGVEGGSRIGVFRKKSADTVACIYGVLKAGCAYVPIDVKMGADRLVMVLDDAGLAALIIEPSVSPKLQALALKGLLPWLASAASQGDLLRVPHYSISNENLTAVESDPAYILYTSGSTGRPKGVQHTHASALAFVSWAATEFNISNNDRLSCHAPFHFDLTIFDLFTAAMTGACVVLIPDKIAMFPTQVASLIEAERVTVWYSVPFTLIQFLKYGNLRSRHLALREVIFAGERFPPAQLKQLAKALSEARFTNLFGPTETNVCTYHHLSRSDISDGEYCPIGKPCPYAQIAVVDGRGVDVAPGEPGELLVGGSSLMTGYLNRPELNKEIFITRTTNGKTQVFYRTGDLVNAPEGRPMSFLGRVDRQVKVRGYRIELDEIEAVLANRPGVIAAAAWVKTDGQGAAEIQAAVATDPASFTLTGEALIFDVSAHLNQAAVPTRIFVLPDLPRNINGKIDYAELASFARENI